MKYIADTRKFADSMIDANMICHTFIVSGLEKVPWQRDEYILLVRSHLENNMHPNDFTLTGEFGQLFISISSHEYRLDSYIEELQTYFALSINAEYLGY